MEEGFGQDGHAILVPHGTGFVKYIYANKIFFGIVSCSAVQHMKVSHVHDLAKISAEIAVGAELQ